MRLHQDGLILGEHQVTQSFGSAQFSFHHLFFFRQTRPNIDVVVEARLETLSRIARTRGGGIAACQLVARAIHPAGPQLGRCAEPQVNPLILLFDTETFVEGKPKYVLQDHLVDVAMSDDQVVVGALHEVAVAGKETLHTCVHVMQILTAWYSVMDLVSREILIVARQLFGRLLDFRLTLEHSESSLLEQVAAFNLGPADVGLSDQPCGLPAAQ